MPSTNVYGFPYEAIGDQPGHSLHGGEFGTEPILAQEVEDELIRVESNSTSLESRIAALEADAATIRWELVSQGTVSGAAFTIPVTAGAYSQLRLSLSGDLDVSGWVELRVNGDTTAALHRYGFLEYDSLGNLDFNFFAETTQWRIAEWATVSRNMCVCNMYNTHVTDAVSYQATSTRLSSTNSIHRTATSWGKLTADRQVSSLNVRPVQDVGVAVFAELRWWLEGLPAG